MPLTSALPPATREKLLDLVATLATRLGANLHAVLLYGSAARGDFDADSSDLNLLIVLERSTPEAHQALGDLLRKSGLQIAPFVLGAPGLERSLQLFGLKFHSIERNYAVLHGADVLAGLTLEPALARLLAEQSLRNLRLRLVAGYLKFGPDPGQYAQFLAHRAGALLSELSNVAELAGATLPDTQEERLPAIAATLELPLADLEQLYAFRHRTTALTGAEVAVHHQQAFELLDTAVRWMEDRWSLPILSPR